MHVIIWNELANFATSKMDRTPNLQTTKTCQFK